MNIFMNPCGWPVRSAFMAVVAAFGLAVCALAEEKAPFWALYPGAGADEPFLGEGWSRADRYDALRMRWTIELDADVYLDVERPTDLDVVLEATIPYLSWRGQRIGLFVNNRYVTEWLCPDEPGFNVYEARIPERYWKEGRNRITLRAAYHHRIGNDSRRLALGVHRLELWRP